MFEELSPPYKTIVADPPWPDAHRLTGVTRVGRVKKERGIAAHYSTMTMTQIADLPVAEISDNDAHLYLWTTNLHLEEAFGVMRAWGFNYRTMLTWCKQGHLGLGAYFRTNTEHVLFGIRGSLKTLDRVQGTYFNGPKRGHSVKPGSFGDIVEKCSPGPYLELFARAPRLGWDSWGHGYESHAVLSPPVGTQE